MLGDRTRMGRRPRIRPWEVVAVLDLRHEDGTPWESVVPVSEGKRPCRTRIGAKVLAWRETARARRFLAHPADRHHGRGRDWVWLGPPMRFVARPDPRRVP